MEIVCETGNCDGVIEKEISVLQPEKTEPGQKMKQQQQLRLKQKKRRRRRGKPKAKNSNNLYKKSNWKFQIQCVNPKCGVGGVGQGHPYGANRTYDSLSKLTRSCSLVPYNTNKFLMEEHLAEMPNNDLLNRPRRTRDSSFSVDSDDNYFYSLPEDEEEFLSKEFANVYEMARVERLENLTKQQLIEECLQIEDRYSNDQGTQRQQQLNVQTLSAEFMAKIRMLEEKVKDLSRENHELRCQLIRYSAMAAIAAAKASPPSASAPTASARQPVPMDSSSEDSESDSSSSSSTHSASSNGEPYMDFDHDVIPPYRERDLNGLSPVNAEEALSPNSSLSDGIIEAPVSPAHLNEIERLQSDGVMEDDRN